MDFIIEFLFDLIFEGSMEAVSSKKVPLPIRMVLGAIIGIFMLSVCGGLIFFGVVEIINSEVIIGILFIVIGLGLLAGIAVKSIQIIRKK